MSMVATGAERSSVTRDEDEAFVRIWRAPPGLAGVAAVNQTYIGRRYILTALAFFLAGGVLALLMRTQLAVPENDVLPHDVYNQLFTMHGTTMMFLFAVPMIEGLAIYLVPTMLGARDLVFPRLSAFGYWCYLFGGLFLYSSILFGAMPDGGWFAYVPLTSSEYSTGNNIDFWLLGVTFVEISALVAATELIVSILKARAPGMSINRMPLFAWYILVTAFMILFAFPPLILASVLLEIERAFDWAFFDPARGGEPLLWQHLFWIFGHPEVYIIFLPAAGIISMVVPTFAQRAMAGYSWVVLAVVGTGFVSMGLWVHHMFTVGIPMLSLGFFSAASMTVSVLSGIQVFAWLATLWLGWPLLRTPLLFAAGTIFIFVAGGLTGVMLAVVPFDWQVHDTHFVVAHFHYVLVGGFVFPLLAGLHYWFPLATGRMMSERLGKWTFWFAFLGFNIAFFPMHATGLLGMPRRVYTYPEGLGLEWTNLVSTAGAYLMALGILVLVWNLARSWTAGAPAEANPWRAGTLEWATTLPNPPYNFRSVPRIDSRWPLWDDPGLAQKIERGEYEFADPSSGLRLTAGTTAASAELEQIVVLPKPTLLPLIGALVLAVFFAAFLMSQYMVALGAAGAAAAVFFAWAWAHPAAPGQGDLEEAREEDLPLGAEGPRATAWWAMLLTIIASGVFFVSILFSYFFLRVEAENWPPSGTERIDLLWPSLALIPLVLGSLVLHAARSAIRARRPAAAAIGLIGGLGAVACFGAAQVYTLWQSPLSPTDHVHAAMTHAMTAFVALHALVAVGLIAFALARVLVGPHDGLRPLSIRNGALFWHYTVIIGLVAYAVLHLAPDYLGPARA